LHIPERVKDPSEIEFIPTESTMTIPSDTIFIPKYYYPDMPFIPKNIISDVVFIP
jgi:hypothetical protein